MLQENDCMELKILDGALWFRL